jgi:hypothetical protein
MSPSLDRQCSTSREHHAPQVAPPGGSRTRHEPTCGCGWTAKIEGSNHRVLQAAALPDCGMNLLRRGPSLQHGQLASFPHAAVGLPCHASHVHQVAVAAMPRMCTRLQWLRLVFKQHSTSHRPQHVRGYIPAQSRRHRTKEANRLLALWWHQCLETLQCGGGQSSCLARLRHELAALWAILTAWAAASMLPSHGSRAAMPCLACAPGCSGCHASHVHQVFRLQWLHLVFKHHTVELHSTLLDNTAPATVRGIAEGAAIDVHDSSLAIGRIPAQWRRHRTKRPTGCWRLRWHQRLETLQCGGGNESCL